MEDVSLEQLLQGVPLDFDPTALDVPTSLPILSTAAPPSIADAHYISDLHGGVQTDSHIQATEPQQSHMQHQHLQLYSFHSDSISPHSGSVHSSSSGEVHAYEDLEDEEDDDGEDDGSQQDRRMRLKASATSLTNISAEERKMLAEEGVVIPPNTVTLTKTEERALKLVRRKLKNKLSAQDSRRKKKAYVDGLEKR